jgi:hypothetical protein
MSLLIASNDLIERGLAGNIQENRDLGVRKYWKAKCARAEELRAQETDIILRSSECGNELNIKQS